MILCIPHTKMVDTHDVSKIVDRMNEIEHSLPDVPHYPPEEIPVRMPIVSDHTPTDTLQRIVGPTRWYHFIYRGVPYHLFGDRHGIKGDCGVPCSYIDSHGEMVHASSNCFTIIYLIISLLQRSSVDLYIEVPYISQLDVERDPDLIHRKAYEDLRELYIQLFDCFNPARRERCLYRTSRFHFVDIRKQTTEYNKNFPFATLMFQEISYIIKLYRDGRGFVKRRDAMDTAMYKIEDTHLFYRTMFRIYLFSNEFNTDISRLVNHLGFAPGTYIAKKMGWLSSFLVVDRGGGRMHKIGAQLDALRYDDVEHDGLNMADIIESFMMYEFSEIPVDHIYTLWERFMMLSDGGVHSDEIGEIGSQITDIYIEIDTLLMDCYTLARMFRTYTGKDHTPSDYMVVYTGYAHTERYRRFFMEWLDTPLVDYAKNRSGRDKCIINEDFERYLPV